jgi:DNA-binding response OmpR family regulator
LTKEILLLVDDEQNILDLSAMYLKRDGYTIDTALDGNEAYKKILQTKPALVVLDLMLPGMDGFEICRKLRAANNQVPIILLTARDEDIDKILGLELGADDYLTKPFNPRELSARVRAILKRVNNPSLPLKWSELISLSGVTIDIPRREVRDNSGNEILLRRHEYELLKILSENMGIVLTREQLLEKAWGFDFAGQTRTVDVHIAQLRKKLKDTGVVIETITGIGYKLAE